jgi:hypothetical protein
MAIKPESGSSWVDVGKSAVQYVLPSLITAFSSILGGYGTAKWQESQNQANLAAQRQQTGVSAYNVAGQQLASQYTTNKEDARMKRLRLGLIGGLRDLMMTSPPDSMAPSFYTTTPLTMEPTAPTETQTLSLAQRIMQVGK